MLHSYVSKETELLIKWIDRFTNQFERFFDINKYTTSVGNKHQWMAYEILDEIKTRIELLNEKSNKKFDEIKQRLDKIDGHKSD